MPEREVFTVILPVYQSAFFNGLKKVQTQENFKILDLYLRATTWFFFIMSERKILRFSGMASLQCHAIKNKNRNHSRNWDMKDYWYTNNLAKI